MGQSAWERAMGMSGYAGSAAEKEDRAEQARKASSLSRKNRPKTPMVGQLRVMFNPRVPEAEPTYTPVSSVEDGIILLDALNRAFDQASKDDLFKPNCYLRSSMLQVYRRHMGSGEYEWFAYTDADMLTAGSIIEQLKVGVRYPFQNHVICHHCGHTDYVRAGELTPCRCCGTVLGTAYVTTDPTSSMG